MGGPAQRLALALSTASTAAGAGINWSPGAKSFWPEEEPKPEWWTTHFAQRNNRTATVTPPTQGRSSGAWVTAADAVSQMGKGINLGNTFDMADMFPDRVDLERNTRIIDLYKSKGFTSVRIPVTWHGQFEANSHFVRQLTQTVEYAISKDLWVMINTHHEHWLKCCYDGSERFNGQFRDLWTHIATHFQHVGTKLVFEVLNEPEGAFGDWVHRSPAPGDWTGIQRTRQICHVGIDAIRAVSSQRIIFCSPNAQGNVHQAGAVFGSKADFGRYDDYTAISVHTYDPWNFCGQTGSNDFFNAQNLKNYYNDLMGTLQRWQWSTGIPVHVGEFGVGRMQQGQRNTDIVREYYHHLTHTISGNGWAPTLWDDFGWYAIVSNYEFVYGLADAAVNDDTPAPSPSPGPTHSVCCWGGCQGSCNADWWCDASAAHCQQCGGQFCNVPMQPAGLAQTNRHEQRSAKTGRKLRASRDVGDEDSSMLQFTHHAEEEGVEEMLEDDLPRTEEL